MSISLKVMYREQWDFDRNIELQILKLDEGFVICLEHVGKNLWDYLDDHFQNLKLAHECFDKTMERAPINIIKDFKMEEPCYI